MHKQIDQADPKRYFADLEASVKEYDKLLAVGPDIHSAVRTRALMRRVRLCFLVLYDYLLILAGNPGEIAGKPLEELADFFVQKGFLEKNEKEAFIILGSLYSVIRWPTPGMILDEEKCMTQVPVAFSFLQGFVARHTVLQGFSLASVSPKMVKPVSLEE